MGEIPNFSEDEPSLSARIRASLLNYFAVAVPATSNFEFLGSIASAINSNFGQLVLLVTVCAPYTRR